MSDRHRKVEIVSVLAIVVGIAAYSHHDVNNVDHRMISRNCREIESLKSQIREVTKFDQAESEATLMQLGIDPASPSGIRLIERARASAAKTAIRFEARDCP